MSDAPASSDPLRDKLGRALQASVDVGDYASTDEALQDAVASWAADREKRHDLMRAQIRRSMEDPRPDIDMEEAFDEVEAEILARMRASGEADEAA
jgi:antitoxin ParD1/3/4